MTITKHFEELRKKLPILIAESDNMLLKHTQLMDLINGKEEILLAIRKEFDNSVILELNSTIKIHFRELRIIIKLLNNKIHKDNNYYTAFINGVYKSLFEIKRQYLLIIESSVELYRIISTNIDKKNPDIHSLIKYLGNKNTELYNLILKLMNNALSDVCNSSAVDQKKSFLGLFSGRYRSKNNKKIIIDNKVINLQVKSMFDAEKVINGKSIADHVSKYCAAFSKDDTTLEKDSRILLLSSMNSNQLQDAIILFVTRTIEKALIHSPELIRVRKANIYVGIYTNTSNLGEYYHNSYYNNIFINIQLTEKMLYYFFQGFEFMPNKTDEYITIVHEIIHSYDWILNNHVTNNVYMNDELYRATWSMLSEEPYPETIAYSKILINLRSEGIADIGAELKSALSSYVAMILNIRPIVDNISSNNTLLEFTTKMYNDTPSSYNVLSEVDKIYATGTIHSWGKFMMLLIIIYRLNNRLYFLLSKDRLSPEAVRLLTHGLSSFEDVKNKYSLIVVRAEDLGDLIKNNSNKFIYMVAFRNDKQLVDQFITQMSLTSLDKFLEEYEKALKFFNMPEMGFSRAVLKAINNKIKKRIANEAKQEGFEWKNQEDII
jgi:hypothetical protein